MNARQLIVLAGLAIVSVVATAANLFPVEAIAAEDSYGRRECKC